jgi:hypothetical protein
MPGPAAATKNCIDPRIAKRPEINRHRFGVTKQKRRVHQQQHRRQQYRADGVKVLPRIETYPSQPPRGIVAKKVSNKAVSRLMKGHRNQNGGVARLKSRRPLRHHHSITGPISTSADVVPPGALTEQRSGRRQPQLPDGQRNKLHCIGCLHPHKHGMLALGPCLRQRLTHIARVADRLALRQE